MADMEEAKGNYVAEAAAKQTALQKIKKIDRLRHGFPPPAAPRPAAGGRADLGARRFLGTALRYTDRPFTTGRGCFVAVNFPRGLSR